MFKSINIKRLALSAITLPLVFAGISAAHAQSPQNNPYPPGTPQYWAWQNRPDLPANLGAPYAWDDNASRQGWPVSAYPRRGDVAVFEPGVLGSDPKAGRVAFVEQVLQDGQYVASAMESQSCPPGASNCAQVAHRTYSLAPGTDFIHYLKDTRTTWGFSSGQSGWTPRDLGPGNMGGPGWFYPLAGADPQLISPDIDVPLAAYNTVEVDIVQGIPVADPTIQVYFATGTQPNFTDANSLKVSGQSDGALHTYTFYFGANPSWKGRLTRLRLDPAGAGTTGGVRVDRVRLTQSEPEPQTYTALSAPTSGDHGGRHR